MMNTQINRLFCCLFTFSGVGLTHGQTYFGVGYVHNFNNDNLEMSFRQPPSEPIQVEDNLQHVDSVSRFRFEQGTGVMLLAGYQIKNGFSVEGRYSYLKDFINATNNAKGRIESIIADPNDPSTTLANYDDYLGNVSYRADAHKLGLHGIYRYSLNPTFYLKTGVGATYTIADLEATYRTTVGNTTMIHKKEVKDFGTFNDKDFDLEASFGVGIRLTSCCNLEIEYNKASNQESANANFVWRW